MEKQYDVVALGADGALVATKEGCAHVTGYPADIVDTTGAGDSFWGGFLHKLLASDALFGKLQMDKNAGKQAGFEAITLEEAVEFARFGNAVASLCVEKRGAIPAMPTMEEVEERL